MRKISLFLLLWLCGCATIPQHLKLTVQSASIDSARPDGRPWHVEQPSKFTPFLAVAGCVLLDIPPAICTAGGALLSGEPTYPQPSPAVWIDVAGKRYQTTSVSHSLMPEWQYSFPLDTHGLQRTTPVSISVIDTVDGSTLGTKQMPLGELLTRKSISLSALGSVKSLKLLVEPLPP